MTASRRVKLDPQLTLYMNHLKRQQRLKHRAWNHENKRKTQGERRDMGVDKVSLDMTPKAQAAKTEPGQGESGKYKPTQQRKQSQERQWVQEEMCANHTSALELLLKYTRSSHNSTQSNTNPVFKWAQDLNR